MSDSQWVFSHSDLVKMCDYAAQNGYEAKDIAYIVEKPWKHADLLQAAERALLQDVETQLRSV